MVAASSCQSDQLSISDNVSNLDQLFTGGEANEQRFEFCDTVTAGITLTVAVAVG